MLTNKLVKYVVLFILLITVYKLQLFLSNIYQIDAIKNLITISYLLNGSLVFLFFLFLDFFTQKFKNQIGFVFMGFSFLKFVLFFIFIYPIYNQDGNLSKQEMITFFIPYSVCLVYESIIVSKTLNNLKF